MESLTGSLEPRTAGSFFSFFHKCFLSTGWVSGYWRGSGLALAGGARARETMRGPASRWTRQSAASRQPARHFGGVSRMTVGGVFVHWVGGGADPPRKAPILREVAGSRTYPTRKAALAGVYALRVHRGCALPLTLSPGGVAHISHPAPMPARASLLPVSRLSPGRGAGKHGWGLSAVPGTRQARRAYGFTRE